MPPKITTPNSNCDNCGRAFYRRPSHQPPSGRNYCSPDCARAAALTGVRRRDAGRALARLRARAVETAPPAHMPHIGPCLVVPGVPPDRYARTQVGGTRVRAHRFVYEQAHGPIPADRVVMHACDRRACIQLAHLALGTRSDNHADMRAKGRHAHGSTHGTRTHPESVARGDRNGAARHPERMRRGERHGMAKLAATDVRAMRQLAAAGMSGVALAEVFGISKMNVSLILRGRAWKHVEEAHPLVSDQ